MISKELIIILELYLGVSEAAVAIISIISSLLAVLMLAFTYKPTHMYLSIVLGILGDSSKPMIRAILSKVVPTKDTGTNFVCTNLNN